MKNYFEQFKTFVKNNRAAILRGAGIVGAVAVVCTAVTAIVILTKKPVEVDIQQEFKIEFVNVVRPEETVRFVKNQEPVEEENVSKPVSKPVATIESTLVLSERPSEAVESPVSNVDISLDANVMAHLDSVCAQYGVDRTIVLGVIKKESTFNAGAVGDSGRSLGLMQIQPRWHGERMSRLGVTDLLDPYQNITVGVDYIADLMATGKPIEWVLMAYNGGPSYANSMWAAGEVSGYAWTVLGYSKEF